MKKTIVGLVVVVAAVGVLAGYFLTQTSGTPSRAFGFGELIVPNPPALNQTATLIYRIESVVLSHRFPEMILSVRIGLSEGFIWVNSASENRYIFENRYLVENVYAVHDAPLEVSGTIKAIKTGRWNILAFTTDQLDIPPDAYMGEICPLGSAGAIINITVSEDSAQVENGYYWSPPENAEPSAQAGSGQSAEEEHPWPMIGHDPQHTSRSPYAGPEEVELKWVFKAETGLSIAPVIGSDGTVYIGSGDNKLYALNPDGTLKWSFPTESAVYTAAIAPDGTIYFCTLCGLDFTEFYALDPDGTLKWSYPTNLCVPAWPMIGPDGTIYFRAWADDNLYALDPDGTLKWSYPSDGPSTSPAIDSGGTIYLGNWYNLCALDPDGTLKWSYPTNQQIGNPPAIGPDGTIYLADQENLYALNLDGTLKWSFATDRALHLAIGPDGTIYGLDNKLYAVNPDGSLKWSYLTTGRYIGCSPIVDRNGTVYFPGDNKLYALNPDGTLKWSHAVGKAIFGSPVIGADARIYISIRGGELYCFGQVVPDGDVHDQGLKPPDVVVPIVAIVGTFFAIIILLLLRKVM